MRIVFTVLLIAASAALTAFSVAALPYHAYEKGEVQPLVYLTAGLWVLFALAVLALRRVPARASVVLVLVGSLAIGVAAMAGPPNTSTDSARYAWDGIVQNSGISPYRYVPADSALEELRTDWLFPAPTEGADGAPECTGDRIMSAKEVGSGDLVCTAINRATVPTIYPPASEIVFAGVRLLTGPDAQYWPMQLLGLLTSLAVTVLLLRGLVASGRDPRWAALWGWSPLVATEGVTNSHIDIVSALLLVAATLLVASGRLWAGGVALGVSIGTKLIPVIGAPALFGRHPWGIGAAAAAVFLVLYVPYILADGIQVLGYLPGYLSEEGYESGDRFIMLSPIAPGAASTVLALLLIGTTALLVWWKSNPADPWLGQLVMIGAVLVVVTPRYPWYALLLVPMIAMTGRWEWFAVPLALTGRLLLPVAGLTRVTVAVAVVVIVVMSIRRAGWVIVSPRKPRNPARTAVGR
jgi:alpha-1,2-mannosyltransferase